LATLGIVAVLELPFHDVMGDHVIRVGLRGPSGEELPVRVEARFRAAPSVEAQFGEPGFVPFGVTVTNVEIPSPGAYTLVLWFDNVERQTYRFHVIQPPFIPSAGGAPSVAEP
jgi:hypothetical protein